MTGRERELERREIRLPDGRRLTFYPFPRTDAAGGDGPAPATSPAPPAPPREER